MAIRALIFDIVRLVAMLNLTKQGDDITCKSVSPSVKQDHFLTQVVTDNQMPVVMWTCTEAGVGIIAACLPNLRPLFSTKGQGFWSVLRSSRRGSRGSSKAYLSSGNTATSSSTGGRSLVKGPVDSCVAEEGIEIHRYSKLVGESVQ